MTSSYSPTPSFHNAAAYLSSAPSLNAVGNTTKLELYAIFKYLTVSPAPTTARPSLFDFTGRAKWDAWKSAEGTYKDGAAAEARYLEIARSLGWSEGTVIEAAESGGTEEEEDVVDSDDIWDKEEDVWKHRGEGSAMGRVTSTMVNEDEDGENTPSRMAIAGDVDGGPDADLNALDKNGYTPLHLAADRGHIEVVKFMLARGADRDLKDEDEYTAKELAEIAGYGDIVSLLSETQNVPS
ncbi:ankyrin [Epithele typhae]|uniref:ankyrin n=1 Tax=Epithele typhae TaxID=378194 RepID=UPI002007D4D1|nr:ankyrin [Epithele typhae]KAH9944144.1 ankyrin [Epithele typhae]